MNPGWRTTEFWGKNAVQLITLGIAAYSIYTGKSVTPEQQAAALKTAMEIIGVVESVYAVSRGVAKAGDKTGGVQQ